jgi:uncharacterized protein YgiM (DUF1202 family)
MGTKLTVQIDASLVAKMRAKAIADGLPNARTMSNEDLLEALILDLVGEEVEEPTPSNVVWVKSQYGLNLRAQPVSGTVLKTLDDGEELSVLSQQGDWLQVRTSDGVTGWVATEYVTREAPSVPGEVVTPPSLGTVWVQPQDGLNLRAGPVSGAILRTLSFGDELSVLGRQGNWLRVRTSDGAIGWVAAEYVSEEKPAAPDFTPPADKGNVRGIHGSAGMVAPPQHYWNAWISELKAMGMAWYKQLDAGDPNDVGGSSTFAWVSRLKQNGIEPIIRYYQGEMFPSGLPAQAFKKMERYAAQGIVWCEMGNEPNLDYEWHSNHQAAMSWQNAYYPRAIVENWINDAEKVVAAGARPGFYALAPTDWKGGVNDKNSSVMFYKRMFEHVAANANLRARFRRLFEPGKAWLAVHVSTYEFAVDLNPFPPGKPPWDMCLRGYEVPLTYLRDILGITGVVVMSTEGGVFCKDSTSMQGHDRLGSHQEHAQRTIEMFNFIQNQSPLRAMCPWLISNVYPAIGHTYPQWNHDGWYDGASPNFGPTPVVQAMKNTRPT